MTVLSLVRNELFSRPDEQHFESFSALRSDADGQKHRCTTLDARDDRILFGEDGANVHFGDATLRLTHYALGLASMGLDRLRRLQKERAAATITPTQQPPP